MLTELTAFFKAAHKQKLSYAALPDNVKSAINWVDMTFNSIGKSLVDKPKDGLGHFYPRFCIKVPTGGGKTLLAVEAIRAYQNLYAQRKTGLIVWVVPSETIYSQTVKKLKDKSDFYRQLLDQSSGGHTVILEKGQVLKKQDIEENLVVLFLMIQSVGRKTKEGLKVFDDSGAYDTFFPNDSRYDEDKLLLENMPNLDQFAGPDAAFPQIKTSLGNVIRLIRPFIIIDEFHKVFSDIAKDTIDNLNPSMVMGLSATPKAEMNLVSIVTGTQLKDEEMIKLDMHLKSPVSTLQKDYQSMVREIKNKRDELEVDAKTYQQQHGIYIRPITLIQVERTGKDQRGKGFVHSLDIKEFLVQLGIPEHQIAIKTSGQNDIEDVDLLARDCEIRYIITKEALKEGWDCPFAYVLGIIPNVNSNTGTTQLVGRILRQPYARKTRVPALDESYVYFTNGETNSILSQIKSGFENEGLEDLISKVITEGPTPTTITKSVAIRPEIKKQFPESLYLPVWLIKTSSESFRPFNYDIDIKPNLDFSTVNPSSFIQSLKNSLSEQMASRTGTAITIESGKTVMTSESEMIKIEDSIDIGYFTRRMNEVIENTFLARMYADNLLQVLLKALAKQQVNDNFGYLVSQITNFYLNAKQVQEEKLFGKLLKEEALVLGISDDKQFAFPIPERDIITRNTSVPNEYKYYLFDDFDITNLNPLERRVAGFLDTQSKVLWWFRNKAVRGWYSIQGWQKQKIRPDFIAAKKKDDGSLELVYVLESKGRHLVGNEDTEYKKSVFSVLNATGKTIIQSGKTVHFRVNNCFQYELIKENRETDEEKQIRLLFV